MSTVLERAGLVTASGAVVGAEGPHPDAKLLELIAEYTTFLHAREAMRHRIDRYKEDGRVYKKLWKELLATREQDEALERSVINTKARTKLGAIAKAGVWLGELRGETKGSMWDLPKAALLDAIAVLEADGA